MAVTRANVERTKAFIRQRLGNPYVYGGALSLDTEQGTDCSEVWQTTLEMVLGRWVQGRQGEGATTESYRYVPVGGVGPFGTIRVASPRDIPANAVAKLAFHHGPGGGANSHMWGELDGMRIESGGGKGLVTGLQALAIDNPYATAWAYLPGPIVGDGAGAPSAEGAAEVLSRATGLDIDRAREILPTLTDGLKLADCTTVRRIAMALAQWGHESDNFNATEEYQDGDESQDRWKYKGRTWIQITWQSNYLGFSRWACDHGLVPTSTYFVDRPRELADLKWAGIGPAWYWTVARPDINALSDRSDLETVTYRINGGDNGIADRRARYNRALAVGDALLSLATGDDDMANVPQDQWDRVFKELTQPHRSRSPLRHLGEKEIDTWAGIDLNDDANDHVVSQILLASIGDERALTLLAEVAGADPVKYPDRQEDAALARRILQHIESTNPTVLQQFIAKNGARA